jgi:hypothetical protein
MRNYSYCAALFCPLIPDSLLNHFSVLFTASTTFFPHTASSTICQPQKEGLK